MKNKENQFFCLPTPSKGVGEHHSDVLALELIRKSGLSLLDVARLCFALVEAAGGEQSVVKLHSLIDTASQVHQEISQSVSFEEALRSTLEQKKHCSPRTIQDIRQTMNALMRFDSTLANKSMRLISSGDCKRLLQGAFSHSPTRYAKARANLSVVFSVAYQHGWCKENPVKRVASPPIRERIIEPLSVNQLDKLFNTARQPEHSDCLPALGLMIYAGVRPEEIRRLGWQDIDWEEKMLYMDARHTKTGGGRHVPLAPTLLRLLNQYKEKEAICPPNWVQRWKKLRDAAGFSDWVPDILRHSFASYHAKMYRNLPQLQLTMGHRDCRLLLTRYINMRGISKKDAQRFWQGFDRNEHL